MRVSAHSRSVLSAGETCPERCAVELEPSSQDGIRRLIDLPLSCEERVEHRPEGTLAACAASSDRSRQGLLMSFQREIAEAESHLASVDVSRLELAEGSFVETAAERTLKVRELHDPHAGSGRASGTADVECHDSGPLGGGSGRRGQGCGKSDTSPEAERQRETRGGTPATSAVLRCGAGCRRCSVRAGHTPLWWHGPAESG
jgi:hypothetical protein